MAKTLFTVTSLNPDFALPYGFYLRVANDGGLDANTDDGGIDDVQVAPSGAYDNDTNTKGIWIDLMNEFEVDGDVAVVGSKAYSLNAALLDQKFTWLPSNPDYNAVAPLLKDGVTDNPDYDDSANPIAFEVGGGGTDRCQKVGDIAQLFTVATVVPV